MIAHRLGRFRYSSPLLPATLLALLMSGGLAPGYAQQPSPTDDTHAGQRPASQEFAPRGQRIARTIKYSDWSKSCFKTPGTSMVCRTSISGTFETGQFAVRIDLIEREGDRAARLQLFLPVGLFLQAGVKITIDQGAPFKIPYVWCLTNTCIAADLADPRLLGELEAGKTLLLEVVNSSVLTVSTSLPLDRFATVHDGAPSRVFEQAIEE